MGILDGAVALVTGGAGGIGRAAALRFAADGAAVMVADRNASGATETAELVSRAGGRAEALACDVTDEDGVAAMVASTVERLGRLDHAFNNAGIDVPPAPLHETTLDAWRLVLEVDLTSVFLCMKHEITHMLAHGGGTIVNTSSGAARMPAPGRPGYSAAKRGVVALTAHAAQEYRNRGIRVNTVLPGAIDTPMLRSGNADDLIEAMVPYMPGKRLGEPGEVADVVVWLCSHDARYVNGQAIVVDGGLIIA